MAVMSQWLKCRVFKGMFSNERTIVVRVKGNHPSEFIVPDHAVQQHNHESRVRVKVLNRSDATWVVLPTTDHESVPVEDTELVPS